MQVRRQLSQTYTFPRRFFMGSDRVYNGMFFVIVGEKKATLVERFKKYHRTMQPGLNFKIPIIDSVSHSIDLREQVIEISSQVAVTKDNVALHIDGVLYIEIEDAYKAAYNVEDWLVAIKNLA